MRSIILAFTILCLSPVAQAQVVGDGKSALANAIVQRFSGKYPCDTSQAFDSLARLDRLYNGREISKAVKSLIDRKLMAKGEIATIKEGVLQLIRDCEAQVDAAGGNGTNDAHTPVR